MAKSLLKPVSVYMTEAQYEAVEQAAMMDNRSVSNLLLTLALARAEQLGVSPTWKQATPAPRANSKSARPRKVASHK